LIILCRGGAISVQRSGVGLSDYSNKPKALKPKPVLSVPIRPTTLPWASSTSYDLFYVKELLKPLESVMIGIQILWKL
jgi:hypothetical protein